MRCRNEIQSNTAVTTPGFKNDGLGEAASRLADNPMLDFYLPMMKTAALVSAGRLGLFGALAATPLTTHALAGVLKVNELALSTLLDHLVVLGYLTQNNQTFALSPYAQHWFTPDGTNDFTPGLSWASVAWTIISILPNAIREGKPEKTLWERMEEEPGMGSLFSDYMLAAAKYLGPDFLDKIVPPNGARRMLDLGGSHGLHSISFCQRYLDMSATIVDLPQSLLNTESLIAREGLADRIELLPGSLLGTNWGEDYDLVLYFSVAHNQSLEENSEVMRRIWQALNYGGVLAIHEYLADPPLAEYNAAFRLTLLAETGTQIYTFAQLSNLLTEAGFESIHSVELVPHEKGTLILATK